MLQLIEPAPRVLRQYCVRANQMTAAPQAAQEKIMDKQRLTQAVLRNK